MLDSGKKALPKREKAKELIEEEDRKQRSELIRKQVKNKQSNKTKFFAIMTDNKKGVNMTTKYKA